MKTPVVNAANHDCTQYLRINIKQNPQYPKHKRSELEKMRHPAAPTIIAVLLGFLAFMVLWGRLRRDGHHEGNPHPEDVPRRKGEEREEGEGEGVRTGD